MPIFVNGVQLTSPDNFAGVGEEAVQVITGNLTLGPEHNGELLRAEAAAVITVPATLPMGFSCGIARWSTGALSVTPGAGATNRSSIVSASAQYKMLSLLVIKTTNGAAAEFLVGEAG